MRLTIEDVQRAISSAGDVATFSELYQAALVKPPMHIAPRLDLELPLPVLDNLAWQMDPELVKIVTGQSASNVELIPALKVKLTIVTTATSGNNLSKYLKDVMDRVKPDILALNIDPIIMAADTQYTFSLPCAVGYSFGSEIRSANRQEIYAKRSFSPVSRSTQTIMQGWLRGIGILPLGKRPAINRLTYIPSQGYVDLSYPEMARWEDELKAAEQELDTLLVKYDEPAMQAADKVSRDLMKNATSSQREQLVDESCYFVSRLLDVLIHKQTQGQNPHVLIISDLAHFQDIGYLGGLLKDGVTDEIYVEGKTLPELKHMIMDGVNQVYVENNNLDSGGASELFLNQFSDFVNQRLKERLSDEEGLKMVVAIAERTRVHAHIARGISVRGSIAMLELLRSLVLIRGHLTREAIGRAAIMAFTPRLNMKPEFAAAKVLQDIVKEVFYGFGFDDDYSMSALRSIRKLSSGDILDKLNQMGQLPQEGRNPRNTASRPAIIPENESNKDLLRKLEKMDFLKKGQNGQYSLTSKAIQSMLDQLEKRMEANEIRPEEYRRQKAILQSKMKSLNQPQFKMSAKELADTIMELIDAQDRQWNKDINFQSMRTYYHIKENSEGANIAEEKRDYFSLQKLIDDLEKRKILAASSQSPGLILTGLALDMLLKYLLDDERGAHHGQALTGKGKTLSSERSQEVRRFSSGDAFRDIAIRPTLREVARQKRNLKDIRKSDLRVFLKQPRKPQSDIVICMDTSGSMGFHQKLLYARLAAAGLIQAAIREKNRIGLVAFNDSGQVSIPLSATNKETLLNCITGINARGNTNIGEGIKTSCKMLFKDFSSNQKHIILVSDGQPTALSESAFSKLKGSGEKDLTEESAILETRAAASKGIQLSVIHIAGKGEANEQFVKNIAQAGKGKIRRISGPADLKGLMS
jgi:Mg-chelatase subunit ChlD